MTLAADYRKAFRDAPQMETVADWLQVCKTIDPNAAIVTKDLGVYIEFSDGSIWRLGASERSAGDMPA